MTASGSSYGKEEEREVGEEGEERKEREEGREGRGNVHFKHYVTILFKIATQRYNRMNYQEAVANRR